MTEKSDRLIRVAGVIEKMELQTTATLMREIAEEHAELLAALKQARSEIWRLLDTKGVAPNVAKAWPEIMTADAAIARATGEKP